MEMRDGELILKYRATSITENRIVVSNSVFISVPKQVAACLAFLSEIVCIPPVEHTHKRPQGILITTY